MQGAYRGEAGTTRKEKTYNQTKVGEGDKCQHDSATSKVRKLEKCRLQQGKGLVLPVEVRKGEAGAVGEGVRGESGSIIALVLPERLE